MTDKEQIKDSLKNHSQNFSENSTQAKEQIIIDGVGVRKCEYLKESFTGLICADCNKSNDCSKSPNCYFKQLVRKTQECEQKDERILELMRAYTELKEKFEALKLENQEGYEIVAELKHECEELKNTLKKLTRGVVLPAIPEPEVINLTDRYRKALEEIEDICNVADRYELEELQETIFNIINKAKGEE